MVHKIEEGKQVIDVYRKNNSIMQVGSQLASDIVFKKAAELYRSGAIGNLNQVVAVNNRNSSLGAWQYSIPKNASPDNIDWEGFLGNAPKVEWDPKRFFRWRCYHDYGTGLPGDLFVHLFTGVHTVVGATGPTRIAGTGGIRSWFDGREAPDVISGQYHYPETDHHPEFTLTLQSNLADGGGTGTRFQFIGDEGALELTDSTIKLARFPRRDPSVDQLVSGYNSIFTLSEKDQNEFEKSYKEEHSDYMERDRKMDQTEEFHTPDGYSSRLDHLINFIDSIRNGTPVFEDPAFGFRAAAPALLTNVSLQEQRVVHWDSENMELPS